MSDAEQANEPTVDAVAFRIDRLSRLTDLMTELVEIPGTDVTLRVTRPAAIDALLDEVLNDPEQNLPYWAEIWPSGIALAAELLQMPELVRGKPVFELGSGVGITASAALMAGADLTISDYSEHSLLLAEITCLQAGMHIPHSRQLNWRDPEANLLQDSGERWPVVVAADVLYEERDIDPILTLLDKIVASGGIVLLAEPGRRVSKLAIEQARARGWTIESRQHAGPWPDPKDASIRVSVHSMKR